MENLDSRAEGEGTLSLSLFGVEGLNGRDFEQKRRP
jgi:hypothetical protein